MKQFFPFLTLFFLFFCSSTMKVPEATTEQLLGMELNYDNNTIALVVVTKGCTTKQDFSFQMKDNNLLVVRKKKDECKALASGLRLTWTFQETGIKPNVPFRIQNSFIANPFTANLK